MDNSAYYDAIVDKSAAAFGDLPADAGDELVIKAAEEGLEKLRKEYHAKGGDISPHVSDFWKKSTANFKGIWPKGEAILNEDKLAKKVFDRVDKEKEDEDRIKTDQQKSERKKAGIAKRKETLARKKAAVAKTKEILARKKAERAAKESETKPKEQAAVKPARKAATRTKPAKASLMFEYPGYTPSKKRKQVEKKPVSEARQAASKAASEKMKAHAKNIKKYREDNAKDGKLMPYTQAVKEYHASLRKDN